MNLHEEDALREAMTLARNAMDQVRAQAEELRVLYGYLDSLVSKVALTASRVETVNVENTVIRRDHRLEIEELARRIAAIEDGAGRIASALLDEHRQQDHPAVLIAAPRPGAVAS